MKGLQTLDSEVFVEGIRKFRDELWHQGWSTVKSRKSVVEFEKLSDVHVAKGCGALGSDVVIVIANRKGLADIQILARQLNLTEIATTINLSGGLQVDISQFAEVQV